MVVVAICASHGEESPTEERLKLLFDADEWASISVGTNDVLPIGRAEAVLAAQQHPMVDGWPEGGCSLLRRPVIHEDGTLQACCNSTLRHSLRGTPLNLGEVRRDLSEKLVTLRSDPLLHALRTLGPGGVAEMLPQQLQARLPQTHYLGDQCQLCHALVSDEQITSLLRLFLSSHQPSPG